MYFSKAYVHICILSKIICQTAYDSDVGFNYFTYIGQCNIYRNNPVGVASTKVAKASKAIITVQVVMQIKFANVCGFLRVIYISYVHQQK